MTILLVSRSVTHHGGHDAIHRLAATTEEQTGFPVRACFLDGAEPSLHAALDAQHVLVCRGPRCTAYGANEVAATLSGRFDDDDVLVTATGCLFPCNLGPLVVVHPDDIWYENVDSALAARIADEHLRDGNPVDDRRPRAPGA